MRDTPDPAPRFAQRSALGPGPRAFALLGGAESWVRAIIVSAMPLAVYAAMGDARAYSALYTAAGVAALGFSVAAPWIARRMRRSAFYLSGYAGFALAAALAAAGGAATAAAVFLTTVSTVVITIAFNAYLMDRVPREAIGRAETLRLFWSAPAWIAGPFVGVWLREEVHPAAPFVVSGLAAAGAAALFLRLGMGEARAPRRAPDPGPVAHLGRFLRQPRLVAGWALATTRSCGWMAFYVYVPVYAVQSGLGEKAGGLIVSLGAAFLLATPIMGRALARLGIRRAVVGGFAGGAAGWAAAAALAPHAPVATAAALLGACVFMVLLDICAGLPFLVAVRPAQRDEMSAVYATFRETSLVATPAVGGAILSVAPLPAVFLAVAGAYAAAGLAARRLPRRLGRPRRALAPEPAAG
jgi:predicted MFS family arabinose efflux permease